MLTPIILWFRQDLRLADHPALTAALATGRPVVPLYIYDETPEVRPLGGAANWWLHHSLTHLAEALAACGAPLILRRGPAEQVLHKVMKEAGSDTVYWSRCYEPYAIARDKALKASLPHVESFNANLLHEPWTVVNKTGGPYQVFTPFWKACLALEAPAKPLPAPTSIPTIKGIASDSLASWHLLPTKPDWSGGMQAEWVPGEAGARQRLITFIDTAILHYKNGRDMPGKPYTSRLSPHMHWGEISPRQIWQATQTAMASGKADEANATKFLAELGWREFSHHLLYHFPTLPSQPLNQRFKHFPWAENEAALKIWQRGQTGFPIVDAGMRQLWQTGWMHNRVRMIVGSFLVKDLLLPWQQGEAWFWDTLVDANLANNTASWQWIAGCGADAAPYFRVFNPCLQGEKFDSDGTYIRAFVPELVNMPDKWIHRPWEAPPDVLKTAGVELGKTYPKPMVDHHVARDRALAAFAELKEQNVD